MFRMAARTGTAHVVTTKRKYKGKVYCTHLLRRSYREDGKVKNETLGNLSHLPDSVIDLIRRSLAGETFVPAGQTFEISSSRSHGHVQAVQLAMQRLGLTSLLASKPCRERDLVLAMVASRILCPATKLATTRFQKSCMTRRRISFLCYRLCRHFLKKLVDALVSHASCIGEFSLPGYI